MSLSEFNADKISQGHYGHVELFVEHYKANLNITEKDGSGYVFNEDNALWEPKTADQIKILIPKHMFEVLQERRLIYINDTALLKKLDDILRKCRTATYAKDCFSLLKGQVYNPSFTSKLNKNADLFPIVNKRVVELDKNTVRTRTQADMFSFECPVDHVQGDYKHAKKFFMDICNNNNEVYHYMLKMFGNCLSGQISEQFAVLQGGGSNGKSALMKLMRTILGPFYGSINKSVVIKSKFEGDNKGRATPDLKPLLTARMITISETSPDDELDAESIKRITGDDAIAVRMLYKDQVDIVAQCKPVILTNYKIGINARCHGDVRRFVFYPMVASFSQDPKKGQIKADKKFIDNLSTKYLNEVFSLLCEYCKLWYDTRDTNTVLPKILQSAKNAYLSEVDTLQNFLDNACEVGPRLQINRKRCFEEYLAFCSNLGQKPVRKTEFTRFMNQKFESDKKDAKTGRHFSGVTVRASLLQDEADFRDDASEADRDDTKSEKSVLDYFVDDILEVKSQAETEFEANYPLAVGF